MRFGRPVGELSDRRPSPVSRRAGDENDADLSEADGAPDFRMRRYRLDPGAEVPRHTNTVEHAVHAVAGEYVVGIEDEERTASEGGSLFVPGGTVHWFRNESDAGSSFVCMGPNGDAGIEPVGE